MSEVGEVLVDKAEKIVKKASEILRSPVENWLEKKLRRFEVHVKGAEIIQNLKGPFIVASNHIHPRGKGLETLGIGPDSFIIRRAVNQATGKRMRIVVKYDLDEFQARRLPPRLLRFIEQSQKNIFLSASEIPIKKSGGGIDFVHAFRDAVESGDPILMYPQGDWASDFSSKQEIKPGVSHLGKEYNLPVVPAYIKGCASWEPSQPVHLIFGEPIFPADLSREEISEKIKQAILSLQSNTHSKSE